MQRMIAIVLALLWLAGGATGQAPAVTNHPVPWLANAKGNLFFSLNADGSVLLVNRSPCSTLEELALVPTGGGNPVVWHTTKTRTIYDRIGLSGDGKTVVFAETTGSAVYALSKPGAKPIVVADVSPDADPRQLRISYDGKWVAFTASRIIQSGEQGRVHGNLYVAATDGSVVHRITKSAIPERYIPFDLSGDGKSVVWLDDLTKGPLVADVDGRNARRISVAPAHLGRVMCDATASVLYFESFDRDGSHLWRVNRDGSGAARLHSAMHGRFHLARGSGQIRLEQFDPNANPPGSSSLLTGAIRTKMFDFARPDVVGTSAWSGDGKVFIFRSLVSSDSFQTLVWRSGS